MAARLCPEGLTQYERRILFLYSLRKGSTGCYRGYELLAALAGVWNDTDSLNVRHNSHTSTRLNNGLVLVDRGNGSGTAGCLAFAEI